jgi:cobalt-zinc-cadmium efflux system protein
MFADAMAISLSVLAISLATKQHTKRLTFGFHRAEVLAALVNGTILIVIASLIVKEGYDRIFAPPIIDFPLVLAIAVTGLAANLIVAFILREARKVSIGVRSAYLHVFYDAVTSIGVITAASLAIVTGIYVFDPVIAFIIAGLILRSAASMLRESVHILLEGTPSAIDARKITEAIKHVEGVLDVHDLHAWTISSGMHVLSVHVIVQDQMVSESTRIVDQVRKKMKMEFNISHTTVQVESDKTIRDIKHFD